MSTWPKRQASAGAQPGDKNKDVARVGHPRVVAIGAAGLCAGGGELGCSFDELARVGLLRVGAEGFGFAGFYQAAALHDGDARAQVAHQRHGMGDEEIGEAVPALEIAQQVDDLRADADVECRDRLVEDEQARAQGEGAGDVDALALATGELVGMAGERGLVEADLGEKLGGFVAERGAALARDGAQIEAGFAAVDEQRLGDDCEHRHARVESGVGILEDGLHLAADPAELMRGGADDVGAINADGAARGLDQAEDHARQRGLAGAGFADQAEGFSGFDGERDVVDDGVLLGAQAGAAGIGFPDRDDFDERHEEIVAESAALAERAGVMATLGQNAYWTRCLTTTLATATGRTTPAGEK
jgi:hypothetical protein